MSPIAAGEKPAGDKSAPDAPVTGIADARGRVLSYLKQAETLVHLLVDVEKDRIRNEYKSRYKNSAAMENDPEFKIRMRELDREIERKKADVQVVLKAISEHEFILGQLAMREKEAEARDKRSRELEKNVKTREADIEKKAAEAVTKATEQVSATLKKADETLSSATKQSQDTLAAANKRAE